MTNQLPKDTTMSENSQAVVAPVEPTVGRLEPERARHAIDASSKEAQEAWAYWMCPTKPGYSTIAKARQAAKDSLQARGEVAALYGYKCLHCKRFHLTRKRNRHGPLATLKPPNVE
jgi:hypothetical protein